MIAIQTLVCAQSIPGPADTKHDYSQEAIVFEQDLNEVSFENDGSRSRVSTGRIRMQSEAGIQQFRILTLLYENAFETLDIDYIRVRKIDGSVVTTPLENVQDLATEEAQAAPLYTDRRVKHIAVKGLGMGDAIEYQAHWRSKKPLLAGQFSFDYDFNHEAIVLAATLRVSIPRDRPIKWKSRDTNPSIEETETRRVLTWSHSQLAHASKEDEAKKQAKLAYDIARGKVPQPEIQISSFKSWEEVGQWYGRAQGDRARPDAAVRAKALSLTKDLKDDDAKAHAIYAFVSSRVHYVGVDLGAGRYQAYSAGEVLANEYGDCKDKETLLAAMLEAVGIHSSPALIASAHDLDLDLPSVAQFDHVINAASVGNRIVWLDVTPEVAPFGYLLDRLRNKPALLVTADKPPALTDTPGAEVPSLETYSLNAKVSDAGALQGKSAYSFRGSDSEVLMRAAFRSVPLGKRKDFVEAFDTVQGVSGDISEVTNSAPEKTDEPFQLSYDISSKAFADLAKKQVGTPMPNFGLPTVPEAGVDPKLPVLLGQPKEVRFEAHLALPKPYHAITPRDLKIDRTFAEYERTSSFKGGELTVIRRLIVKQREVAVADFDAYSKFRQAVVDDAGRTVPLSNQPRSLSSYREEMSQLPATDNTEAEKAYAEADAHVHKREYEPAILSLRRAVDANPRYTRAWLWMGELYKYLGKSDEAIKQFRTAMAVEPHEPVSYKALAFTLISINKLEDAVPVLQELMKQAPDDVTGVEALGTTMLRLKRYGEAAAAFEAACQLEPDDAAIRMRLGHAYLHAHEVPKAMTTYAKAVELEPSATIYNNIAYELADADVELSTALQYSKKAVDEEIASAEKVKLPALKDEDLAHAVHFAHYWDTLGWVYFRMGNLEKAEQYLKAAWTLSQVPVVGAHLGQLYERQNKPSAATHIYHLALAAPGSSSASHADDMQRTRDRLAQLESNSAPMRPSRNQMDALSELSRSRTTPLPRLVPGTASGEFFLLFDNDKIEDVKMISGSEQLRSADRALKAADYKIPTPNDAHAHLVRRGLLMCSAPTGCVITLMNPSDVKTSK